MKKKWVRIIGIVDILSEKRRIYGSIQDINSRKTAELNLVEAKLIAEQSVALKNDFLANMSHEIRTPMNAIIGFSDILRQTSLNENQKECVDTIATSADNLLYIINDILDFSKIESGKMIIENIPFDLNEILKNSEKLFSQKAKSKEIEFNIITNKPIQNYLLGDKVRLNQVLINLIGNAIKFTHMGKVELLATIQSETEEQCKIKFEVVDSGIGLAKEKIDLIFERFNQAESFITRKYGGTGLGLSISKSLVELMGGSLQVESELGNGSNFFFTLNFKKEDKIKNENFSVIKKPNYTYKPLNILLFEDNLFNQRLAIKVVEGFGFCIDFAIDVPTGLEMFKQKKYDLILMDLQMPGLSGYDATKIIRKELNSLVPIIAMTAHSLVGEKEKCLETGMNDYISKPFKQDELFNKITQQINIMETKSEYSSDEISIDKSCIDLKYLRELSSNDKNFEKELLELFLNDTSIDIKNIQNSFDNKDINRIREIIHKIKPSLNVLGATQLFNDLESLKNKAMNEQIYDANLLEKAQTEYEKCSKYVFFLLKTEYQ